MKKILLGLLFSLLFPVVCFAADSTFYVDTDVVGGAGDGSSWANAYDHLADVEALNLNLTTGTYDGICTIYVRGATADNVNVAFAGWTTNSGGYPRIIGDWDPKDGDLKYDTTKYHLTGAGNDTPLQISGTAYIEIMNIQVVSGEYGYTIDSNTDNNYFKIHHCYIGKTNGTSSVVSLIQSENGKFYNNLVYRTGGTGNAIDCNYLNGNTYIYSNTIYGSIRGIIVANSSTSVYAKNNISQNNSTACYSGTFNSASTNNLASDTTAPGSNPQNSKTVSFVSTVTPDFHLSSSDTVAVGMGANLYADSAIAITTDIDGDARPNGAQDIGADEYIAPAGPGISIILG